MKTAINVLLALAAIFTLIMTALLASNSPAAKHAGFWFFAFALGGWIAYIVLLLGSKHVRNKTLLSIAPETQALSLPPTTDEMPLVWTDYTEDLFHAVIWRWHYKPQIDKTPRDLTPYCPECGKPTPLHYTSGRPIKKGTREGTSLMNCPSPSHRQMYLVPVELDEHFGLFANVKREIQHNLESDKWKEIVARQRKSLSN